MIHREHAQREMEKRIVAQLLTSMDDLNPELRAPNSKRINSGREGEEGGADSNGSGSASGEEDEEEHDKCLEPADFPKNVIVIGATNRPDAIDPGALSLPPSLPPSLCVCLCLCLCLCVCTDSPLSLSQPSAALGDSTARSRWAFPTRLRGVAS